MIQKDSLALQHFSEAIQHEWIETNGLGGWSGSTLTGCNTRRYHGLLVAATVPPVERMALVSKLDETIWLNDRKFELATNNYGDTIAPTGYTYLHSFTKNIFPEWIFEIPVTIEGGITQTIRLKKTIAMIHGENTTVILYEVQNAPGQFTLELLPLVSVRGYHSLMLENESVQKNAVFANEVLTVKAYDGTPDISIKVPGSNFTTEPNWYRHFYYAVENYRGLDCREDLFTHGHFQVMLSQGETIGIILSTENVSDKDATTLLLQERKRRENLLEMPYAGNLSQVLTLAADQFIVKRDEDLKTVIAGYHWFTDWGRDTMISLPGLCISTGRFEDAKKILSAFAGSISQGMLPNRFQDNGEAPEYNNVDGTLWFFIAVQKYWQATGDKSFILDTILPVLTDIIEWHYKGTRYQIRVTEDELLYAGEVGQQLTWMDARIGNWVVTPRMGKPVEIQALWYNALCIYSELLLLDKNKKQSAVFADKAKKARQSFTDAFWNPSVNGLYDFIDQYNQPDLKIRPNQLFAISLPYPLVEGEKAKNILSLVETQLYTPVGLKSLAKTDTDYIPVYGGDAYHRDSSYHEGTAWSWLLGPYIDAIMKTKGSKAKAMSRKVIKDFEYHLNEACLGTVSEIFDAEFPHHPRGCVAQAWGVAEILRVIKAYGLE